MTIADNIMVFITTLFMYIHVKQLLVSGSSFMINGLLGIWISLTVFDMYGRWRLKNGRL